MAFMGGGNPISVAANFRLVFDTRSATRTATQYDAAMSNMAAKGTQSTIQANDKLQRAHNRLVKQVMADNAVAEETFKTKSREVFQQVKRNADAAYAATQKRTMYESRSDKSHLRYKIAAQEYKTAMKTMTMVNNKYAADMKRLGISASTGEFSARTFGRNTAPNRKIAIQHILYIGISK